MGNKGFEIPLRAGLSGAEVTARAMGRGTERVKIIEFKNRRRGSCAPGYENGGTFYASEYDKNRGSYAQHD